MGETEIMAKIIVVETREPLPIGYAEWKQLLRIRFSTLKKVKSHTFRDNLRIRVENEK